MGGVAKVHLFEPQLIRQETGVRRSPVHEISEFRARRLFPDSFAIFVLLGVDPLHSQEGSVQAGRRSRADAAPSGIDRLRGHVACRDLEPSWQEALAAHH